MKFQRLDIKNFACYSGQHSIDLNTSDEKSVVIVIGSNGYGKTSMFNAIIWALYGEDYERDLKRVKQRDITDYVNEAALKEAYSNNESLEMNCVLYFEHDDHEFYITQFIEINPTKNANGKVTPVIKYRDTKLNQITPSGDHKEIKHYKLLLDEMLPNNVRDYFLFDGDRISALASPGSSQEVRDAIYRVVDLELLQRAKEHLDDVAKEYARDARRESKGELHEIEEQYNKELDNLEKRKNEQKEIKAEIESVKRQIEILEEKLKNLPDTSKLQERRNALRDEIRRTEKNRDEALIQLRKASYTSSLSIVAEDCRMLVDDLNKKIKKGEVPKQVAKTFMEEMINSKQCFFCLEKIEPGNKIYNAIIEKLEQEKNKKSNDKLLDYRSNVGMVPDFITESIDSLKNINIKIHEHDSGLKELKLQIDQIDSDLEKLPKEDSAKIAHQLKEFRNDLIQFGQKDGQISNQILILDEKIKKLDHERKELSKKETKVKGLQLRESLARKASEEIEKIYEWFAEDSRASVEKLTIEEFKNFVFSSSEYTVSLSKDYELEVQDSNGNRALQRLSMGQSQCLSLAFITAISRVSEKNPPLVIDMPFGRLDETVHSIISERLPKITSQLILFLLPNTEWNDQTRKNLKMRARHIYQLDFDNTNRKTEIKRI